MTDTTTEQLLTFEKAWLNKPQHDGAKMHAVHEQFGLGIVRYYQALVATLDDPEAWAFDPVTCGIVRSRMHGALRRKTA